MLDDTPAQTLDTEDIPKEGIPASEIRPALDRVLASRVFIHSHRICAFLQFIVEECLAGRHQRLKEYLIGLEVFHRSDLFDPRVDSIVRVEARRLRTKLDEYYLTDGRDEDLRIVLRKGSYVPIFEYRRHNSLGFNYSATHALRRSLALAPITVRNGGSGSASLAEEITRRLTHILIKEGYFQVAQTMGSDAASPAPDYIIEGSVELHDGQARLLLQLLHVSYTAHVWSEMAEFTLADLSPVDDLARALNRELLAPVAKGVRAKLNGEHKQAYDCYLQGRFEWKRGTAESIKASIQLFQKAVEADPGYGAAWAALAEASALSSLLGLAEGQGQETKSAAERACALNPDLSEAHVALGAALTIFDFDYLAGETELQRAIQLGPADATAHVAYGAQLACRGLHPQAIAEVERALELNPASLLPNFLLGWLYGVSGRLDDAIAQHSQVAKMAPDFAFSHLGLGWAYAAKNLFPEAVGHLEKARGLLPGLLGYCYAKMGRLEDAQRELVALNGHSLAAQASIRAGLGDREHTLVLLEQAWTGRDPTLPLQWWGPQFSTYRHEPRLSALRRQQ